MLQSVLTGEGAAAAREHLQKDTEFQKTLDTAFGARTGRGQILQTTEAKIAHDLVREGNISLATIVTGDKGIVFGYLDNEKGLQQALAHASDAERSKYLAGRGVNDLLAKDPKAQLTDEQKGAKAYFDLIDGAIVKSAANEREITLC